MAQTEYRQACVTVPSSNKYVQLAVSASLKYRCIFCNFTVMVRVKRLQQGKVSIRVGMSLRHGWDEQVRITTPYTHPLLTCYGYQVSSVS